MTDSGVSPIAAARAARSAAANGVGRSVVTIVHSDIASKMMSRIQPSWGTILIGSVAVRQPPPDLLAQIDAARAERAQIALWKAADPRPGRGRPPPPTA